MIPIETALSRLGSRLCLNFRPQSRVVAHGALGRFLDEVADLFVGLETPAGRRVLPLCREGEVFEAVHMELTMTSVTFRGESRALGLGLTVTFTAPFWPRDAETSTAPVFFVDLTTHELACPKGRREACPTGVQVFLGLRRPGTHVTEGPGWLDLAYVTVPDRQTMREDAPPRRWLIERVRCQERIEALTAPEEARNGQLRWHIDLRGGSQTISALWVARVEDPVFERRGRVHRFLATGRHATVEALSVWTREHREALLAKSRRFDALISGSSLSKTQQDLIAFTFQSYLMNTWWVEDEDGSDWFSVWEGCCRFHSTVDVEYNVSVFYLALWPELLAKTLDEWADHEKPGPPDAAGHPTGFLSHDMGACQHGDGQEYGHDMEVEENCNFALLLHALWRWTADARLPRRHAALLARAVRFVIASDTTGNGFPDRGVANTIDDASPAIQFAREQTYLAVKAICAARAAADIARALGDETLRAECEAFAGRAAATLDREAWLGDHFAVCIDRSSAGVCDMWRREALGEGALEGWDAYSIYSANGLVLPLLTGLDTGLDLERMRTDLQSTLAHARAEYGCTHSSADRGNLWISQNLWRDCAAALLGLDFLNESERYWAFEIHQNRASPGHCFIDTHGWNCLDHYPRGITSLGLLLAAPGLRLDRVSKTLTLRPVRVPLRVPLLPLADWARDVVPWAEWRLADGQVVFALEDHGLLDGWTVHATPAARGTA